MSGKIQATPVAVTVPFDNSTNGFTATNVQTAIEEAKASGGGGSYDEDKIAVDYEGNVAVNYEFNVSRVY